MSENTQKQELAVTDDLKNILAVLKPQDAKEVLRLKEELADNWNKKQIFRTETEMRISVLNDVSHPTPASKYWQSVREMSAHFDALMNLSFDMRKTEVERLRLERKMKEAELKNDNLEVMEIQIDLDQNLYNKACMEQVAHDRVREIQTWSKIKGELNDGTFDDRNVNTHQSEGLLLRLENRVRAITPSTDSSEVLNAVGPYETALKLRKADNTLLTYDEVKQLQLAQQAQSQQQQQETPQQ
jgi:hypothetical protein